MRGYQVLTKYMSVEKLTLSSGPSLSLPVNPTHARCDQDLLYVCLLSICHD